MSYSMWVTETVERTRVYTVDADSIEQAKELAMDGETLHEQTIGKEEIVHRRVISQPIVEGSYD